MVALNASVNASITTPFVAAAWGVQVIWASSDLGLFNPESAPLLQRASSTGASASQTPPSTKSGSATPTHSHHNGLSSGEEPGIGVGVAVAVLIVVAVLIILILRRRKRQRRETAENSPATSREEHQTRTQQDQPQVEEIDGRPKFEASSPDSRQSSGLHEADSVARYTPAELDGGGSR